MIGCGGGDPSTTATAAVTTPDTSPALPSPASSAPVQSPAPGSAVPVPRTVTPADTGQTFSMAVGQTAELIVPDPRAPDPVVAGSSIELVEVVSLAATNQREWELRAVTEGRSTITGGGAEPYVITVVVGAP